MKKFVLISCFLGSIFLLLGGVLAFSSIQKGLSYTISAYGTIVDYPKESQSQQADYLIQLDQIGYITIVLGVGFFIASFLYNQRSVKSH